MWREQTSSQSKQTKNDHILPFYAPGIKHPISVPFQYGKLLVCEACKLNCKRKFDCRDKAKHTNLPWTTVYLCITLDSTCTDEEGKIYRDKMFVGKRIRAGQYRFKQKKGTETPICAACKERNSTRYYCREKRKNRDLPWTTTFVILSAYDKDPLISNKKNIGEETVGESVDRISGNETSMDVIAFLNETFINDSKPQNHMAFDERKTSIDNETTLQSRVTKRSADASFSSLPPQKPRLENSEDETEAKELDFFENIDESRTFIALLSSKSCSFEWLEIGRDPENPRAKIGASSRNKMHANTALSYGYYHHPHLLSHPISGAYYPPQYHSHSQWGGYGFPQSQTIPQVQRGYIYTLCNQQHQHHESCFPPPKTAYSCSDSLSLPVQNQERPNQAQQDQLSQRDSEVSSDQQPISKTPPSVLPHNQYPMQESTLSHNGRLQDEVKDETARSQHNAEGSQGSTHNQTK